MTGGLATLLATGFFTAGFDAALAAGLAGLLASALRALGDGAFARPVTDGFDFAALFLVFDAALAMAYIIREREKGGRLTPRYDNFAQAAKSHFNRYETAAAPRGRSGQCKSGRSRPPD